MDFETLKDEEVIEYALNYGDKITQDSVRFALQGSFGIRANKKKMATLLRNSLTSGKTFRAAFDDGESCDKPRKATIIMMID